MSRSQPYFFEKCALAARLTRRHNPDWQHLLDTPHLIFGVCPKVSGMSRFADIFLLPWGPRASLTPKGPFEKNINESRKAATNFGTTSIFENHTALTGLLNDIPQPLKTLIEVFKIDHKNEFEPGIKFDNELKEIIAQYGEDVPVLYFEASNVLAKLLRVRYYRLSEAIAISFNALNKIRECYGPVQNTEHHLSQYIKDITWSLKNQQIWSLCSLRRYDEALVLLAENTPPEPTGIEHSLNLFARASTSFTKALDNRNSDKGGSFTDAINDLTKGISHAKASGETGLAEHMSLYKGFALYFNAAIDPENINHAETLFTKLQDNPHSSIRLHAHLGLALCAAEWDMEHTKALLNRMHEIRTEQKKEKGYKIQRKHTPYFDYLELELQLKLLSRSGESSAYKKISNQIRDKAIVLSEEMDHITNFHDRLAFSAQIYPFYRLLSKWYCTRAGQTRLSDNEIVRFVFNLDKTRHAAVAP